ncbi:MAG: hypothetical protein EOM50_07735 [Erysipelotrichia bacterium]|nr:hypothetical protein [Erysipelotrichia bacterium]NCC54746.1 hypothetical protein [Erysipelotrichia bacterium]
MQSLKKNKKYYMLILGIVVLAVLLGLLYVKKDTSKQGKSVVDLSRVSKHLNICTGYVLSNQIANLYKYKQGKYQKAGSVNSDVLLSLDEQNRIQDEYYKLNGSEYYIAYQDVKANVSQKRISDNVHRYVPFNENVKTLGKTELYNIDGKLKYTILDGIDAPVYQKKDNAYYVLFMDELLLVKSKHLSVYENSNTQQAVASTIPVFMYHFFYDETLNEQGVDANYTEIHNFKAQLTAAKQKGYQSVSMHDLELFLDGSIRLPYGSFVITIDDNAESVKRLAYPVLEQLQMHATNFVVTSWVSDFASLQNPYIELQSHSDAKHTGGCSGIQHGGLFNCIDYESGLKDVRLSSEKLADAFVFCYPFGDVDENMKKILHEGGYRLAFTTKFGYASAGMDKLELPRVRVSKNTSVEAFMRLLEG